MSKEDVTALGQKIHEATSTQHKVRLILEFVRKNKDDELYAGSGLRLMETWTAGDDSVNMALFVANEGGIRVILGVMHYHAENMQLQITGARALGLMAQNPSIAEKIAQSEGVCALLNAVYNHMDPDMQEVALMAFQNLCVDKTAKKWMQAGAVHCFAKPLCDSANHAINTLCYLLENEMQAPNLCVYNKA